jgi:Cu/Ag efflux pump CusA
VRGRGYIKSLSDLEQIVVRNDRGVPLLLKDVAAVVKGIALRSPHLSLLRLQEE